VYYERNRERGRMGGQVRVRFRKHICRWFDHFMVSREEMKAILKDTGWKVNEFIDSEGESDARYVAVIPKGC
jgi:hypothetical protein